MMLKHDEEMSPGAGPPQDTVTTVPGSEEMLPSLEHLLNFIRVHMMLADVLDVVLVPIKGANPHVVIH